MTESIQSPLPTLTELSTALKHLQTTLDPLLSRPLAETLAKLEASLPPASSTQDGNSGPSGSSDPSSSSRRLDSAKLRTSIAYVLLDLVWIHLRLKGVDPHTHPVAGELKRVQGYFVKIRSVEKAGPNSGSGGAVEGGEAGEQRMRLDGAAAKRMVRGAIAEGGERMGRHTKFGGGEDGEGGGKKDGKAKQQQQGKGQRRVTKDPFDGYGDGEEQQQKGKGAAATSKEDRTTSKKTTKKRHSDEAMGGEASTSTSVDSSGGGASKHQKKKQKKQRRA